MKDKAIITAAITGSIHTTSRWRRLHGLLKRSGLTRPPRTRPARSSG
ncbi:MAG: hypothetical protein NTV99_10095 [Deltaproteobacteria bacterium]|nr:hypothetical protein [Deltaproteobacteria bacterium]